MPYKDPELKRQKHKEYSRRYYEKNKEETVKRVGQRKREEAKEWAKFKSSLKCINCGFAHPAVIDFHHVILGPENVKINALVKNNAYKAAKKEIEKCVPLCANCHRIHHYDEHQVKKRRRKKKLNSVDRSAGTIK